MTNKVVIAILLLSPFIPCTKVCTEPMAEEIELTCQTMHQFYSLWSDSWFGEDPSREKCAWMIRNSQGNFEWKRWPTTRQWKKEIWKDNFPRNVVAQVHTHPVNTDPRPSSKDRIFSKTVNAPLYTVSRKGIWRITPAGKMTQVAGNNWHINLYKNRCKPNL